MCSPLPPGWAEHRFGDLCERIVNGGTPSTDVPTYWGGTTPWVTGADFTSQGIGEVRRCVTDLGIRSSPTSVVKAGNLLIVTRTGVGKLAVAPFDIAISQDVTGVYLNRTRADVRFAYHLLSHELEELKKLNQGTSINGIVRSDLEGHLVRIPGSLPEQQRIAAILTSVDSGIEATEALIDKYQQIKAGLMHDLFTRGVPHPGIERTAHNWEFVPACRVCSLITKGTTPPAEEMWQGGNGVRFLRVDNLTLTGDLNFDASDFRVASATHATTLARSRCQPDDVLMNIVGPPLGKVGLVTDEEVNINQAIAVFRPTPAIDPRYMLLWLTSEFAKRWILQRAKQTSGQVNVTLAMCQALPIPLAPIEEQRRIVERVQAAEAVLKSLSRQVEKLRMQKNGLMQDLLTGKVRVRTD